MNLYLVWILSAIALATVEVLTGTFYLLALAVAAAGGAALAYADMPLWTQATLAAFLAVIGVVAVHRYRARVTAGRINAIDVGFRVSLDSWVDESEGLARVRYRGTLWNAKVIGERGSATTFYVRRVEGGTLHIAPERA